MEKLRIVFMGSPDFAVPALRLLAQQYQVVGAVTQPDRPAGRGMQLTPPPVKAAALELGIPVIQPEKLREPGAYEQLQAWAPDLIIVAAFGQILRKNVLDLPRYGCVNIHASLLPRHRGAAPIQAAILEGDRQAGVTIMKMDEGLDTGPMISQAAFDLAPDETGGSLFAKLSSLGGELLMQTLPGYLAGELQPVAQPSEGASYFGMIRKEDGVLDPALPAAVLERKVRAFNPWPGTSLQLPGMPAPLKIHHASVQPGHAPAGTRTIRDGLPAIATADGWLLLDEVQPAGKKPMPGKAFLAGYKGWPTP